MTHLALKVVCEKLCEVDELLLFQCNNISYLSKWNGPTNPKTAA